MHHLVFNTSKNPHCANVSAELDRIKKQAAKIYSTYVDTFPDGNLKRFVFVTTSKQVHLDLGIMSWPGQIYLVDLFESEFNRLKISQLVFRKEDKDSGGFLVTLSHYDDGSPEKDVVFTISPAN